MAISDRERANRLRRLMWLAVLTASATVAMKVAAWLVTGSVGMLSDAAESLVNLVAAFFGLAAVTWASRPADEDHAYGHDKANYLAAGFEGALILLAAATIAYSAVGRLLDPTELESLGLGISVIVGASAINFAVGRKLIAEGRRHGSMAVEADGRHLLTDVWTSAGVVAGVTGVWLTGWQALDPIVALLVTANIIRVGVRLVRDSTAGLMDRALEPDEVAAVEAVLRRFRDSSVEFHALRTRRAGRRAFISLHILVPGAWSIKAGHDLAERVEQALRAEFDQATIFTHLEPVEDPVSFHDTELDREPPDHPRHRP